MRPNFQGLPWFEFDGLGDDELLLRFLLNRQFEETVVVLFFSSHWGLIWYRFLLLLTINVARITLSRSVFTAF